MAARFRDAARMKEDPKLGSTRALFCATATKASAAAKEKCGEEDEWALTRQEQHKDDSIRTLSPSGKYSTDSHTRTFHVSSKIFNEDMVDKR